MYKMDEEQALCFVIGIIMNQSIPSDQVWKNVIELKNRIKNKYGKYDIPQIISIGETSLESIMRSDSYALHRFPKNMSKYICETSYRIFSDFDSKVTRLWYSSANDEILSVTEIYNNLLKMTGIGKHKAIQAIIMLSEIYKFNISNDYLIYIKKECPNFIFNYLEDINTVLELGLRLSIQKK